MCVIFRWEDLVGFAWESHCNGPIKAGNVVFIYMECVQMHSSIQTENTQPANA